MSLRLFFLFFLCPFLSVWVTAQTPEWVRSSSYVHPSLGETGSALDTDAAGNVIFAGEYIFGGTINGVTFLNSSTSVANCFIATANSSGSFNWVMQVSGGGAKAITDAKWSAAGDVLVCGYFAGTIMAGSLTVTSAGALDMFLLRINSSGTVLSLQRFGGTLNDFAYAIDVDASGQVYVAGSFNGSFTFGSSSLTSAGGDDGCLLTLSAAFAPLWAVRCGGTSFDRATEIVADQLGAVYVVFEFSGTLTFNATTYTTLGSVDILLVKVQAASGVVDWSVRSGGTGGDQCAGIAFDGVSTVFVGINTSSSFQLGAFSLTSAGCSDLFVFAISSAGTPLWLNRYGVAVTCESLSDLAFGGGFLYLVGSYNGSTTFGTVNLSLTGMNDAFIIKADPLGEPISVNKAGGTRNDLYNKVAVNNAGMVYVVGSIYGNSQMGTITTAVTGAVDAILVKYNTALLLPASVHFWQAQAEHAHQTLFEWSTSEEVNTAWFCIEHSSDGLHFNELHRTAAQGTTFEWTDYAVRLQHDFQKNWYYRLVVEDANGGRQLVGETEVSYINEKALVFYQPTWKKIVVQLPFDGTTAGAETDITVYDASLKVILQTTTSTSMEWVADHWPTGIYLVTLGEGENREIYKLAIY
jgi:hypothetical protein